MVPALRRHDFLLDESQKLLALRQGYTQSRDVAGITSTYDLEHVDTAVRTINPGFHQAQNQLHPHSPAAETYGRSSLAQHTSPTSLTVSDNDVTSGANLAHLPVTTAAVRPTTPSSKPFPSRHSDGRSPPDPQRSELDRACSGTIR